MKKLMVYLDDDLHESLRVLAFRKRTSKVALVRYALDKVFEDELDAIAGERALEEAAENTKKDARRRELLAASKDPLFLADIEEIERDFAYADVEAARMIQ